MKCMIEGCDNHTGEGRFIGAMCAPHYKLYFGGRVDAGAFAHFLKEGISEDIHTLVNAMLKDVDGYTASRVREQLADEFRFYERSV